MTIILYQSYIILTSYYFDVNFFIFPLSVDEQLIVSWRLKTIPLLYIPPCKSISKIVISWINLESCSLIKEMISIFALNDVVRKIYSHLGKIDTCLVPTKSWKCVKLSEIRHEKWQKFDPKWCFNDQSENCNIICRFFPCQFFRGDCTPRTLISQN